MSARRARVVSWWALSVLVLTGNPPADAEGATRDQAAPAVFKGAGRLPIVAEHRYRLAAKIRPLLFFWIGRDQVGAAHAIWRRSPDGIGFELLIGSDPAQAPRRINRWGYIAEEVLGSTARLIGLMKQSDEASIEQAAASIAAENQGGPSVFRAIRGTVDKDEASAAIITLRVARDLTFGDVDSLLELVERTPAPAVRRVLLPRGTRPGFLTALADLIHRDVAEWGSPGPRRARRPTRSVPYIYNGTLYDLAIRTSERLREAQVGRRRYENVIRARFEIRNRASGTVTDFALLYGTAGSIAEIPVHAVYRPRWWLQVELFLEEGNPS